MVGRRQWLATDTEAAAAAGVSFLGWTQHPALLEPVVAAQPAVLWAFTVFVLHNLGDGSRGVLWQWFNVHARVPVRQGNRQTSTSISPHQLVISEKVNVTVYYAQAGCTYSKVLGLNPRMHLYAL